MNETGYTYCQICELACGLKVTHNNNRILEIAPDKKNPHSWRDFCVKGASAHEIVEHPQRIMAPMQRVGGRYVERSYAEALSDIAARFTDIIDESGPAAIASYAGNPNGMDFGGSLFLSLFMDAIGSHNRYWVSSIDQNALHYVAEKMYGHAFATMQLDLDNNEYLLLIGANPAVSGMCWIGYVADGWKKLLRRQADGKAKIVIADPRKTESANKADIHLATNPDQDWALLLGLIKVIFEQHLEDVDDCANARGVDQLREITAQSSLEDLARRCDIPAQQIADIAVQFAQANGAAAVARTGSAIGINGSLSEWLSHALNLITGNTDRTGGRFYNPGLVDPLIAGDEIFRPNRVPSRVRDLPTVAGFHSTAELPGEIETPGEGQVRALIISAGNPVVSGPNGSALDSALAKLDCLVAIDLVQRESHRHADWLIPAAHWLEREEFNPLLSGLNNNAFAQTGNAVVTKPHTVRHEWEFLRDLAIELKAPLMNMRGVNTIARISRAFAKLSGNPYHGFGPDWISRLLVAKGSKARFRDIKQATHGLSYGKVRVGALRAVFKDSGQTIDAAPVELVRYLKEQLASGVTPQAAPEFPLQLLSRRRRHTMNSWYAEVTAGRVKDSNGDWIDLHPSMATLLDLSDGDTVRVVSKTAAISAHVRFSSDIKANTAVMEQGWGSRVFDPVTGASSAIGVNRNLLVGNDELDPLTGVPRLNGTPIRVEKVQNL